MLAIQVLIVLFVLFAISRVVRRFRGGGISPTELLGWTGFWILVAVAVLTPELTQRLARLLGVGRGADAILYLAVVTLSYAFFRLYMRLRDLERQLTILVRALALDKANKERPSPPSTA